MKISIEWQVNGNVMRKSVSDGKAIMIGRHPNCDIVLGDPHVSRRHASIYFNKSNFHIHNLSQTNPILFNDSWPLTFDFRADLQPGDTFTVGRVRLKVGLPVTEGNGVSGESELKARCPSCSKLMAYGQDICSWCGTSLAEAETVELEYKEVEEKA